MEINQDFKDFFKKLNLNVTGFKVKDFSDSWPKGKSDPSEYRGSGIIAINPKVYDFQKDPYGWVIHEIGHWFCEKNKIHDDLEEYPFNRVERYAFGFQFLYLSEKNPNNIFKIKNYKPDIDNKYINQAMDLVKQFKQDV